MISLIRIIKYALQNFFRNFWMSMATLSIIVVTLIFINVIIIIDHLKSVAIEGVEQRIDILLDFKHAIAESEVLDMRKILLRDERVDSVELITPASNYESFKRTRPQLGDTVAPILSDNPFGYTLRIKTSELGEYENVLTMIEQDSTISDKLENTPYFNDFRAIAAKASAISEKINSAAVILATIFFFIAMVIVYNAIRVSIYTQREEIAIMRLVGATGTFIRMPYIIESLLFAALGVGIFIVIAYAGVTLIQPQMVRFFGDFATVNLVYFFTSNLVPIYATQFVIVAVINIISAMIALTRYLKI